MDDELTPIVELTEHGRVRDLLDALDARLGHVPAPRDLALPEALQLTCVWLVTYTDEQGRDAAFAALRDVGSWPEGTR